MKKIIHYYVYSPSIKYRRCRTCCAKGPAKINRPVKLANVRYPTRNYRSGSTSRKPRGLLSVRVTCATDPVKPYLRHPSMNTVARHPWFASLCDRNEIPVVSKERSSRGRNGRETERRRVSHHGRQRRGSPIRRLRPPVALRHGLPPRQAHRPRQACKISPPILFVSLSLLSCSPSNSRSWLDSCRLTTICFGTTVPLSRNPV